MGCRTKGANVVGTMVSAIKNKAKKKPGEE
jgi:hypothetical protein